MRKHGKKMKVLLTGASGFIGRYVLRFLQTHGIDTVVIGRHVPLNISEVKFKETDLLSQVNFNKMLGDEGFTHLLHLAWYAEHGAYWKSTLNLDWLRATIQLVDAFCNSGGRKVVIAGTCAEYEWKNDYCNENTTRVLPNSLYGAAKDATRRLAEVVCTGYQVDLAWGRIFFPYGRGEDLRRLIPSLSAVFKGERSPFGVNANAYRDFLHVEDIASAFVRLLDEDAVDVYNVCSGHSIQLIDIVKQIAKLYGADPRIVLDLSSARPGEPNLLVGDNQKLLDLGWRPLHAPANKLSVVDL